MGYWFQGFFVAVGNEAAAVHVRDEVQHLWPQAITRRITSPFQGVGVSRTADAFASHESPEGLDDQFGPWTRRFPDLIFVRIEVVCFGGVCEYGGTAWQNGQVRWHEERDQPGDTPLIRLLEYLGIISEDGYFEPFTRGYFDP